MTTSRTILILWGFCALRLSGMQIHQYSAAVHDRFANQGSFIAGAYDLSGVAIVDSATSNAEPFLTLVHPNVALSAIHYGPGVGSTVRFRLGNDPAGPVVERTVTQRIRAGTSDLLLCILDAPVTEDVAVYAFATETLSSGANWANQYRYANQTHLHIGKSPGSYTTEFNMAVGQNKLDGRRIGIEVSGTTGNTVECKQDSSGDANFVSGETMGEGGDSSGPLLFIEADNSLTVVGIAWYITQAPATGFTAVGDYSASIQSAIQTHGQPFQPLPPDSVQADWGSGTDAELTWTDNSNVETGYEIQRASDPSGPWTAVATLPADSTGYTDPAVAAQQWHYRVRSLNQGVTGEWVEVSLPLSYQAWASTISWSGADSGPLEDANSDTVTNLAAFGFALSPFEAADSALPSIQSDGISIQLNYRKNPEADSLIYRFRQSGSLESPNWQDLVVDGVTITETELGPEGDAVLMRIEVPLGGLPSPVYFRFEVEEPVSP